MATRGTTRPGEMMEGSCFHFDFNAGHSRNVILSALVSDWIQGNTFFIQPGEKFHLFICWRVQERAGSMMWHPTWLLLGSHLG